MSNKLTTEEFIEKAKSIHGDWYDYSKVEYVGNKNKVIITCPVHGDFEQIPNSHLNGSGCYECGVVFGGKRKLTTEQFIEKAKSIHGDKYDYSKVEYIDISVNITITCPIHGDFEQSPRNHNTGSGCPKCKSYSLKTFFRRDSEYFIDKAKEIHGDWYDYSKVEYTGNKTKATIICPVHGEFEQVPSSHLRGRGCPECSKETSGFWNPEFIKKYRTSLKDNPCTLYVIECYSEDESFIKVGITTKTLEERYKDKKDFVYQYNTIYEYHSTLIECSEIEQEVLKQFKDYQYEPVNKFGGSTECLHGCTSTVIISYLTEDLMEKYNVSTSRRK